MNLEEDIACNKFLSTNPSNYAFLANIHAFVYVINWFYWMQVNAHVKALRTLCKQKALNTEEADSLVMKWVYQLLSKASKILETYMSKDLEGNKDGRFFTPPTLSRKGKRATATMSRLLSQAITAVYTIGSLVIICPSADLKAIVPVLHRIITSGSSDPKFDKLLRPAISIKQTAPSLYIQAWLAMGKICLADGKLAKRYIPLFVEVWFVFSITSVLWF